MARPGVNIQIQAAPPSRSAPTDSGVAFMAGLCDKGALEPILVQSLDQFSKFCGGRVAYSALYDAVDFFFREGGNSAYISRVVGPAADASSVDLVDAIGPVSLTITANSPGEWGQTLEVAVIAGDGAGTYRLTVGDSTSHAILETSPDLTTQQDAVTWAQNFSNYITATIGASAAIPKVAAAAPLTGGDDDRASITKDEWQAAIDLFTRDLGPGQVLAPGLTTDDGHTSLTGHAAATNRVALLDLPDTAVLGDLESSAATASDTDGAQFAASFAPWCRIPGVVAGTSRVVAPSAGVAGVIARVDAVATPNTPAAGELGQFRSVIGLSQPAWSDADREELNGDGINVIRSMYSGFRIYGCRSLADPVNNPGWIDFSNVRYLMWLAARCEAVGEQFVFSPIDGQGKTISDYGAALAALCQADWNAGIIFGATATEAFNVDTGSSVNTPETIADNELRAVVAVRPDPFAELVTILIVNVPVTEAVA